MRRRRKPLFCSFWRECAMSMRKTLEQRFRQVTRTTSGITPGRASVCGREGESVKITAFIDETCSGGIERRPAITALPKPWLGRKSAFWPRRRFAAFADGSQERTFRDSLWRMGATSVREPWLSDGRGENRVLTRKACRQRHCRVAERYFAIRAICTGFVRVLSISRRIAPKSLRR